jgi:hypothetical protein
VARIGAFISDFYQPLRRLQRELERISAAVGTVLLAVGPLFAKSACTACWRALMRVIIDMLMRHSVLPLFSGAAYILTCFSVLLRL